MTIAIDNKLDNQTSISALEVQHQISASPFVYQAEKKNIYMFLLFRVAEQNLTRAAGIVFFVIFFYNTIYIEHLKYPLVSVGMLIDSY